MANNFESFKEYYSNDDFYERGFSGRKFYDGKVSLDFNEIPVFFKEDNPSCVVVMADRHEVLGPAIAASYQNIPLVHIQGGELSGNIDNKVRYAISSLADLHFPATNQSCLNLINMGIAKEQIIYSGCPSIDLAIDAIKNEDKFKTQQIINNEDMYAANTKDKPKTIQPQKSSIAQFINNQLSANLPCLTYLFVRLKLK